MKNWKRVLIFEAAAIVVAMSMLPWLSTMTLAHQEALSSQTTSTPALESNITSFQGVEYSIRLQPKNHLLSIEGTNRNNRKINYTGVIVNVDGYRLFRNNVSFDPGETRSWEINVTHGLDVLEESHHVTVSTFGDSAQFNFTKEIDPANPGPVPTPYIEEVRITNGTIDGEPSAVAKVTLVNPSIQTYPTALAVHTLDTDGSFYPASVRPGGTTTITVELLDERGTQIVGEARLYAGNLSQGNGAMDQVGFVGRAGEKTNSWNETYEPIKGPWRNDPYEYHNATYEEKMSLAEKLSGGYEFFGVPIAYLVAGLLGGLTLVRRWR